MELLKTLLNANKDALNALSEPVFVQRRGPQPGKNRSVYGVAGGVSGDGTEAPLRVRAAVAYKQRNESLKTLPTKSNLIQSKGGLGTKIPGSVYMVHVSIGDDIINLNILQEGLGIMNISEADDKQDLFISALLTYWRLGIGESIWKEIWVPRLASSDLEWTTIREDFWEETLNQADLAVAYTEITDEMMLSVLALQFLCLTKNLDETNYATFMERRINSLENKLNLNEAQKEWVVTYTPTQLNCGRIRKLLGNRTPMRTGVLDVLFSWDQTTGMSARKMVADILLTLFECTEMTHINLISKFVFARMPAILNSPILAGEAECYFLSVLRMANAKEYGPYLKMIHPSREIPEMASSKMPILHAFARELSIKERANMSQYAPNLSRDNYGPQLQILETQWQAMSKLTTVDTQALLKTTYGPNAPIAKAIMEGSELTQTSRMAALMSEMQGFVENE